MALAMRGSNKTNARTNTKDMCNIDDFYNLYDDKHFEELSVNKLVLTDILNNLDNEESAVLKLHMQGKNRNYIGKQIGHSHMYVSNMQKRIKEKVRCELLY